MKRLLKATALALAAGVLTTAFAAGPIVHRQVNQQARIGQGVRSGSLTRGETAYIQSREAALSRSIRRDRIDGGGLTLAERTRINHQQNNLSRQIYGLKHNGRTR